MNVFFKLKFGKLYDAMLATPLQVGDVTLGEIAWCLSRGGVVRHRVSHRHARDGPHRVRVGGPRPARRGPHRLRLRRGGLRGHDRSCAAGRTSTSSSWSRLPLFLFSTTFYPLSTYSEPLQWVVRTTPLYHGVELMRSLTLGTVSWDLLGHVAYFLVMGAIGLAVADRRLHRLLLP